MYRIKPAGLFTIDGDSRLTAVDTLVKDTYTMAVVARDERLTDTALIVVHVQDVSAPLTSAPTECNRWALVALGVICALLLLLLLILITCFIIKYRR